MPLRFGAQVITGVRLGATPITAINIGSTQVWGGSTGGGAEFGDEFAYADGPLDPTKWTHLTSTTTTYRLGVDGGALRLRIPDQDGSWWVDPQNSDYKLTQVSAGDDGYVEVRIASPGDTDRATQVLRRCLADGSKGVGMHFAAGAVSLIRRNSWAAADYSVMANCGSMVGADTFRLNQTGNLHVVTRNGAPAGSWNDTTATAAKGAANRTVVVHGESLKELFWGRRFSPSLDYVHAT